MPKQQINGFEMFYEAVGDGFPVAFIHGGFGGMASTLDPQPPLWRDEFARRYRVVTYDRRSAGRSSYPSDGYSLDTFARDLRELLESLGVERSHLIGASAGGPIAITYALTYPDSVKALVLVNTAPQLVPEGAPTDSLRERVALLDREGAGAAYEARRTGGPVGLDAILRARAETAPPELVAEFLERQELLKGLIKDTSREERVAWYAGETRNYSAYLGSDLTGHLSELAMPTFVIHGEADSVVPVANGHKLHEGIQGSVLKILPGAEHGLMDRNEDAQRAILDFLMRVDGSD